MVNEGPLLDVDRFGYDVGSRTLWDSLAMTIERSDSIAVRGVSGQGKSTLLRCIGGLERPSRGHARVRGMDVHRSSARDRRRLRREVIGFVMQDHAVVPQWSIAQNLRVVRGHGLTRDELDRRIGEALGIVGLGGRARMRAGLLSGGEQQRVAVARVLVQRPKLVLADEPTASLDPESAAQICEGLEHLRTSGAGVVVATHDPGLIAWASSELTLAD